jgi:hypothetical protein
MEEEEDDEDGGESNVNKEQNGRELLRKLKPIVGCNGSKRRGRTYLFIICTQ